MCLSTRSPRPKRHLSAQVKPTGTVSLLLILAIPCTLQILAIALITILYLHQSPLSVHLTTCPASSQLIEQSSIHQDHWPIPIPISALTSKANLSEFADNLFQAVANGAISDSFRLNTQSLEQRIQGSFPLVIPVRQFTSNNFLIATLALLWVAITVGSTIYLSRKLTRPIVQLSYASQRIAQGEFVPTISLGHIREIAVLASSFNAMCAEVQHIRQTLALHSQILEQKAAERIQTLEQEVQKQMAIEAVFQQANQDLAQLAFIDGLTKLLNRRHFDDRLNQEWWRLQKTGKPLSVILCDIDYFKQYNDTYGHLAGDECLRQVSRTLQRMGKHPADVVARYGGEEFTLLLPETTSMGAIQIAYEIQAAIRSLQITHRGSPIYPYVTVSLGVASLIPQTKGPPQQLIAGADRALYQAKSKGRDCIVVSNPQEVDHQKFV